MKSIQRKINVVFLAVIAAMAISLIIPRNVQAASYPSVFFFSDEAYQNLIIQDTATVGDTVHIRMKWYSVFNNEGYDLTVYGPSGTAVANGSKTFTNIDYSRTFDITWDTTGLAAGNYTAKVTKKFYSFYRWNEAPTTANLYITLNQPEIQTPSTPSTEAPSTPSTEAPSTPSTEAPSTPSTEASPSSSAPVAPTVTPSTPATTNTTANKVSTFKAVAKRITAKVASGRKKAKVVWKRISGASGYQIRYSLKKNMKGSKIVKVAGAKKTSKIIKKLTAKKKYYFQIRAYKVIKGKTYYGSWSAKKTVKIKK